MHGLKIADLVDGVLAFDLKEVLSVIGEPAISSTWKCSQVECLGENAERLGEISDSGRRISGQELFEIAKGVYQVIDGEFEAYRSEEKAPWLVVNAVDSSFFEVLTDDAATLEAIRTNFSDVSLLPAES